MFETTHKTSVAIDIETTGFQADGEVTVFGMLADRDDERCANVILNTSGRSADTESIKAVVEEASTKRVNVTTVMDEASLLHEIGSLMFEQFDNEYNRLVAFNGQTWRGGFDIPFLRSRCNSHGIQWVLHGCDYVDLYPIITKRFHTTLPDENGDLEDNNDLVRSHCFLCEPDHEFDPYESSQQAVTDHYNEEFTPLVQHNVSDVHRTLDLAKVAEKYASPKQMRAERL